MEQQPGDGGHRGRAPGAEGPDGEGDLHLRQRGADGSLLPEGVIDEIKLALVPVVLGRGKRLFGEGARVPLTLLSSEPVANGTVILSYAVG